MLGGPGHSRLDPSSYKVLQLQRRPPRSAATRKPISKLPFLQPYFECDYSDDQSSRIAQEIESYQRATYIKETRNIQKETPAFVEDIRNKIIVLHQYNLNVAKVALTYPLTNNLVQLLLRYLALECKVVYKREHYTKKYEQDVQERIYKLLRTIYYAHFESTVDPPCNVSKECSNAMIDLFIRLKTDYDVTNKIVENIVVALLNKTRNLSKVDHSRGRNPTHSTDSDSADVHLVVTSDYGTDDFSPRSEGYDDVTQESEPDLTARRKVIPTICIDDDDKHRVCMEKECAPSERTVRQLRERTSRREREDRVFASHKPIVDSAAVKEEVNGDGDSDSARCSFVNSVNKCARSCVDSDSIIVSDDEVEQLLDERAKPLTANATTIDRSNNASFRQGRGAMETENNNQRRSENVSETFRVIPTICLEDDGSDTVRFEQECQPSKRSTRQLMAKSVRDGRNRGAFNAQKPLVDGAPVKEESAKDNRDIDICDKSYVNSVNNVQKPTSLDDDSSSTIDDSDGHDDVNELFDDIFLDTDYHDKNVDDSPDTSLVTGRGEAQQNSTQYQTNSNRITNSEAETSNKQLIGTPKNSTNLSLILEDKQTERLKTVPIDLTTDDDDENYPKSPKVEADTDKPAKRIHHEIGIFGDILEYEILSFPKNCHFDLTLDDEADDARRQSDEDITNIFNELSSLIGNDVQCTGNGIRVDRHLGEDSLGYKDRALDDGHYVELASAQTTLILDNQSKNQSQQVAHKLQTTLAVAEETYGGVQNSSDACKDPESVKNCASRLESDELESSVTYQEGVVDKSEDIVDAQEPEQTGCENMTQHVANDVEIYVSESVCTDSGDTIETEPTETTIGPNTTEASHDDLVVISKERRKPQNETQNSDLLEANCAEDEDNQPTTCKPIMDVVEISPSDPNAHQLLAGVNDEVEILSDEDIGIRQETRLLKDNSTRRDDDAEPEGAVTNHSEAADVENNLAHQCKTIQNQEDRQGTEDRKEVLNPCKFVEEPQTTSETAPEAIGGVEEQLQHAQVISQDAELLATVTPSDVPESTELEKEAEELEAESISMRLASMQLLDAVDSEEESGHRPVEKIEGIVTSEPVEARLEEVHAETGVLIQDPVSAEKSEIEQVFATTPASEAELSGTSRAEIEYVTEKQSLKILDDVPNQELAKVEDEKDLFEHSKDREVEKESSEHYGDPEHETIPIPHQRADISGASRNDIKDVTERDSLKLLDDVSSQSPTRIEDEKYSSEHPGCHGFETISIPYDVSNQELAGDENEKDIGISEVEKDTFRNPEIEIIPIQHETAELLEVSRNDIQEITEEDNLKVLDDVASQKLTNIEDQKDFSEHSGNHEVATVPIVHQRARLLEATVNDIEDVTERQIEIPNNVSSSQSPAKIEDEINISEQPGSHEIDSISIPHIGLVGASCDNMDDVTEKESSKTDCGIEKDISEHSQDHEVETRRNDIKVVTENESLMTLDDISSQSLARFEVEKDISERPGVNELQTIPIPLQSVETVVGAGCYNIEDVTAKDSFNIPDDVSRIEDEKDIIEHNGGLEVGNIQISQQNAGLVGAGFDEIEELDEKQDPSEELVRVEDEKGMFEHSEDLKVGEDIFEHSGDHKVETTSIPRQGEELLQASCNDIEVVSGKEGSRILDVSSPEHSGGHKVEIIPISKEEKELVGTSFDDIENLTKKQSLEIPEDLMNQETARVELEKDLLEHSGYCEVEKDISEHSESHEVETISTSHQNLGLVGASFDHARDEDDKYMFEHSEEREIEKGTTRLSGCNEVGTVSLPYKRAGLLEANHNDIEDVTEKESLQILDDVPSQKDTLQHSEDGEVEKQISAHSQDHIVETVLIPHTQQLGASYDGTSGIKEEGSVGNLQEIQLRDEFTEGTVGIIKPNHGDYEGISQVTVTEEDIEISQVSKSPEAELLVAENVTEQLGEGVEVVNHFEAGDIVVDQSTGEYAEVTYLSHAQDVQDQQEALGVPGNQPTQEIVIVSNPSQVEEQSKSIHEIPQESLRTSSESLGAIHVDDVKDQTSEGVVEAMSASHEIDIRPRDPVVIEQVGEIVLGNQSTETTDEILTSKDISRDACEDQLVQKSNATKTIRQSEELHAVVCDEDNALGEKIDIENNGTTLRSELSKAVLEGGEFHTVVKLAEPALSETQKDEATSPGGASESPAGESDKSFDLELLGSMREDDDGAKAKNSVAKTLFVKLEQMTELSSRKKSTPQPSRADSEATVYLFVHHDETNMEQHEQIYSEEQEIVAVANDKFVIDETLIDEQTPINPPAHLDIDHAHHSPLVYFEDDELRGDDIAHDLVVHNEEVVTETIFLYSDSYDKPKLDEDVVQPSPPLELVPLPEDNSLVLLANVAASQQLQTPSTSKTGRRRSRQPARKEQQTESATASRKRKPKQKYVPNAEDLANKRITRSALTRSTTEATETSLPVPHDFLTSSPSLFTGTTDRHYTHKPPDVCSTSEDTNDSEFNNLYIDKEKDTSNELLSVYDEDTLDEVLERRYDVRIQAPMVLSIPDGEVNEYELLDQMERMAAFDGIHGTRQTHGEAVPHVTAETERDDLNSPPGVFVPRDIEFTTLFTQVPSRCPTEMLNEVTPKPFRTMAQRKEYYKLNPYVSIERLNMKCVESQKVHLRNTRSRSLDINWIRSVKLTDTLTKDDGNFKLESIPYDEKSARHEVASKEINIESPKDLEEIKDGREVAEVPELGPVRENSDDNMPLASLKMKLHDEDFDEVPLLERLNVKSELGQSSQETDIVKAVKSQEQHDKTDITDARSCQTTSSGPPTEPSLEIDDITKTHVFKENVLKKSHSTNNTLNINDMESPNWKYYTAPKLRQKSISKDSLNRLVSIQNEAASSSTKEKLETTTKSIGGTIKTTVTDEKYLLLPKLRRKSLLETTEMAKDATKRKPKTVDLLTKCKNTVSPIAEKLKRKLENDKIFQTEGQPLINDITCTPKSTKISSRESVSEENTTFLELLDSPEKAIVVKQIKGPIKKNIGRFFDAESQWLKRTEDNVEEPPTQPIFHKVFGENHETNSNGTQSMIPDTPKSTKRNQSNKSEKLDVVQNLGHPKPIETDIQDTINESTQPNDILAPSTSNAGSFRTEEVSTETNAENAICTAEETNSNPTTNDPNKTNETPNSSVVSEINVGAGTTEFTSKESTPTNSKSRRSKAKAFFNFAKKINHLNLFHSHLSILNRIESKRSKNVEHRESTKSERQSLESNHRHKTDENTGESKTKTKETDASVEMVIESVDNVTVPSSKEMNKISSNSKPNNTNKKSLKVSDSRRGSRRSRSRSSTTENKLEVASKDDSTETQLPIVHTNSSKRKRNEWAKSTSFPEQVLSDSFEDINSISNTEITEASSQINGSDARAEKSEDSVGAIEHPLKKRPGRPKSKPPPERNIDSCQQEDLQVPELQFENANSGVKNNSTPKKRPGRPKSLKLPPKRKINNSFDVFEDLGINAKASSETYVKNIDKTRISSESPEKNIQTSKKRPGRSRSIKLSPERNFDIGLEAETICEHSSETCKRTQRAEENNHNCVRDSESSNISLTTSSTACETGDNSKVEISVDFTEIQTPKKRLGRSKSVKPSIEDTAYIEAEPYKILSEVCKQIPKKRLSRLKSAKSLSNENNDSSLAVTTNLEATVTAGTALSHRPCEGACLEAEKIQIATDCLKTHEKASKKRPGRPKSVKPPTESKVVNNLEITKTGEAETIDEYSSRTEKNHLDSATPTKISSEENNDNYVEDSESSNISVPALTTSCGLEAKNNNEVQMSGDFSETNIQAPKKRPGRPKSTKPPVKVDTADLEAENISTDKVSPKACKQIPKKRLSRSKSAKLPSEENDDSSLEVATDLEVTVSGTTPQIPSVSSETQEETPKRRPGRPKAIKRYSEENTDVCAKVVTALGVTEASDTSPPKAVAEDATSQLEIINDCTISEDYSETAKKSCKKRPGRPKSTKPPLERCIDMVGNSTEFTEVSDIILEGINNNGIKISSESSELCKQIPKKRPGRRKSIKPSPEQYVKSCSDASLDIDVVDTTSITQIENIDNDIVKMAEDSSEICETTSKKHHGRPKSLKLPLEQNHDDSLGVVDNLGMTDLTSPNKPCESIDSENGEGGVKLSAGSFGERKKRSYRSKSVKLSLDKNHDDRLGVVEDFGVTVTSDLTSPNKSCESDSLGAANDESYIKLSADSPGACKNRPGRRKTVKLSREQNDDDRLEVVEDLSVTAISDPSSSNKPCETMNSEAENGEGDVELSAGSSGERKEHSDRFESVKQSLGQNDDDGLRVVEDLGVTVKSDPNKLCEILNSEADNREGSIELSANSSGERSNSVKLTLEPNHYDRLEVVEDLEVTVTSGLTSPNKPRETVSLDVTDDKDCTKPSAYSSGASKKRPGRPKSVSLSLGRNNDDSIRVVDDLGITVTSEHTSPSKPDETVDSGAANDEGNIEVSADSSGACKKQSVKLSLEPNHDDRLGVVGDSGVMETSGFTTPNTPCETVGLDVVYDKDGIKPSTYSSGASKKRPGRPKSVKLSLERNNDDCVRVVDDLGITVTSDLRSPSKPDETVDLEEAKDEGDIEVLLDSSGACNKPPGRSKSVKLSLEPNHDDRLGVFEDFGVTVTSGRTSPNKPCETDSLDVVYDKDGIKPSTYSSEASKKRPGRPKSVKLSPERNNDDCMRVVDDLGITLTSDLTSPNKPDETVDLEAAKDEGDIEVTVDSSGASKKPPGRSKSVKLSLEPNDDRLEVVGDSGVTETSGFTTPNKPSTYSSGASKKRPGRPKSVKLSLERNNDDCMRVVDDLGITVTSDLTSPSKPDETIDLEEAKDEGDIEVSVDSSGACKKPPGRSKSVKLSLEPNDDGLRVVDDLGVTETSGFTTPNKPCETVRLDVANDEGDIKLSAHSSGKCKKRPGRPKSVKLSVEPTHDDRLAVVEDLGVAVTSDPTSSNKLGEIPNLESSNDDGDIKLSADSSEACTEPSGKSAKLSLEQNNDDRLGDVDDFEMTVTSDLSSSSKPSENVNLETVNSERDIKLCTNSSGARKKRLSRPKSVCYQYIDNFEDVTSSKKPIGLDATNCDIKPHTGSSRACKKRTVRAKSAKPYLKQKIDICSQGAHELEVTATSDMNCLNKLFETVTLAENCPSIETIPFNADIHSSDIKIPISKESPETIENPPGRLKSIEPHLKQNDDNCSEDVKSEIAITSDAAISDKSVDTVTLDAENDDGNKKLHSDSSVSCNDAPDGSKSIKSILMQNDQDVYELEMMAASKKPVETFIVDAETDAGNTKVASDSTGTYKQRSGLPKSVNPHQKHNDDNYLDDAGESEETIISDTNKPVGAVKLDAQIDDADVKIPLNTSMTYQKALGGSNSSKLLLRQNDDEDSQNVHELDVIPASHVVSSKTPTETVILDIETPEPYNNPPLNQKNNDSLQDADVTDMTSPDIVSDTVTLERGTDDGDFEISADTSRVCKKRPGESKSTEVIDDLDMSVIAGRVLEIVTSEVKNDQHESTKSPPNDININCPQDADKLEVTNSSGMAVVEKIPVETVIPNAVSDDGDVIITAGKIPEAITQHLEQNNDLKIADNSEVTVNSGMASPKIPSETKPLSNSSRKKRSPRKRSGGQKSAKPLSPDADFGAEPCSTASTAVNSKSKNIDINYVKLSESTQKQKDHDDSFQVDKVSVVLQSNNIDTNINTPAEETDDTCLETSSNKAVVAENLNDKKTEVLDESPEELQNQINSNIAKEIISLKSPFQNSTIPEENVDEIVAEAFERRAATLKKHNDNYQVTEASERCIPDVDCDKISISKMNDQQENDENCSVTDNAISESRKNDELLNGPMEELNADLTDEKSIHLKNDITQNVGVVVEETCSANRKRKLDTSSSLTQFDDVLMESSIAKRNKYEEITIDTDLRNQKRSKTHSPLPVSPGRKEKKRLESIINELKENTCIVRPEKHESLHEPTLKQKLAQKINNTDPDSDRVIESGQDQQLEGCLSKKDAELVSNNPQVLSSDPTSFLSSTDPSAVFNPTLPAEPLSTFSDSRNKLPTRLEPSLAVDRKCGVNSISNAKSNTTEIDISPNDKIHLKSGTSDEQCSNPSDATETETDSNEHSMNFGNLVVSSNDGGILSKVITMTSADTLLSPTTSTYSFKNDGHIFREPKDPVESADAQVNPDADLSLDFSDISPIKMFIARDGPLDLISPNNFINDVDYPQSSRDCNHSDTNNEANDDSDHLGGPLLNGKTEDKDLFPSYNQPTNVSNVFPFTFSQLLEVGEYNEINPEEILEILDAKLEPATSHDNEYAAKNLALPAQPTAESNQIGLTDYNLAELECTLIETTDNEDNINCKESDFAPRTDTWSHFFANECSQQKVIVIHNEQYPVALGNSMEPFAATYTSEIHNRKNTTVLPVEEIKRSKLGGVVTKTKVDIDISSKISSENAPTLSQSKRKPGDKIQFASTNGHVRRNSAVDKPVTTKNDSVLVAPEMPDPTPNTVYYKIKPRTDLLPPKQSQEPIKAVLTSDKLNKDKRPVSPPDECLNIFDKIKLYKRGAKKVDAPVNVENVPAKPRTRRKPGRPKNLPPDVSEPSQPPKLQIAKPKNAEKNEKYEILNTDNLLKLKMKPINRKQQNATNDSKYSNSYSMDNILKKDQSDGKEANGKRGDNNHERNGLGVKRAPPPSDHSEPSSSSSKLRRVEDNHGNSNKDQLFDRLVEQGNLNSVCSLMVTEDNKLKLVRERRPSYSRNNGAPYERRGDTNRWGRPRKEETSRPYPYQGHEKKYQDNNVSGSSRGRPQSQYASTSGRFSSANSSSSHGWRSDYKPTSVRTGYVPDYKGPFDKGGRMMGERMSGTNDLNNDNAWHKKYDHFCPAPQSYTDRNARSSQARSPTKNDNKKEDTWYKKFDRFYPSHHQAYGFDKPHRNESK